MGSVYIIYDSVTIWDAVPHDFDIVISVCPGLLVPETQRMKELVFDGGDAVTVASDGQSLLPNVSISHWGETAFGDEKKKFISHRIHNVFFWSTFVAVKNL